MAITLGTFKLLANGVYTGTLKTLTVDAAININPVEKTVDNAPSHRVYTTKRCEIGAAWSQTAKSSGETYLNAKIAVPEFGPNWFRFRIVKLDKPSDAGATHIALWEPSDK